MKKQVLAALAAAFLAVGLCGCSFSDVMLYLYGGDDFTKQESEPVYASYTGGNGVTVIYDANRWLTPSMAQDDTLSVTAGGSMDSTVVLLQTGGDYTDFLAQSGQELEETTGTVRYDFSFTVPDATVESVRYDCGSYQMIFAEITYDRGGVIDVSAATKLADESKITDLLQNVYPAGETPETAAALHPNLAATDETGRPKSLA